MKLPDTNAEWTEIYTNCKATSTCPSGPFFSGPSNSATTAYRFDFDSNRYYSSDRGTTGSNGVFCIGE